jgi:hypothetical protein
MVVPVTVSALLGSPTDSDALLRAEPLIAVREFELASATELRFVQPVAAGVPPPLVPPQAAIAMVEPAKKASMGENFM